MSFSARNDYVGASPAPSKSDFHLCGKAVPLQAWTGPWGSMRLRLPEFLESWYMKVVRLSGLRTGRLYPPGDIPGTHFCKGLSQPKGHIPREGLRLDVVLVCVTPGSFVAKTGVVGL